MLSVFCHYNHKIPCLPFNFGNDNDFFLAFLIITHLFLDNGELRCSFFVHFVFVTSLAYRYIVFAFNLRKAIPVPARYDRKEIDQKKKMFFP